MFDLNYDPLKEVHKNKIGEQVICLSDYLSVWEIVYFMRYNFSDQTVLIRDIWWVTGSSVIGD